MYANDENNIKNMLSFRSYSLILTTGRILVIVGVMRKKKRFVAFAKMCAAFFTDLAAGYFFAIYISPNGWSLTNNIILCILCAYLAFFIQQFLEYE
jgi:hypothetical protein